MTSAVASAVAIPNRVLMFTGGTNPALTKLKPRARRSSGSRSPRTTSRARCWRVLMADAFGKTAKINVAARNDAYGTNLSAVFKDAWTAGGGTIPQVRRLQPPAADARHRGAAGRRGKPGRLALHRLLPDLREARAAARPHRQVGSGEELRLRHAERLPEPRHEELARAAGDPGERLVRRVVPGLQGALRAGGQGRVPSSPVHGRGVRQRLHRLLCGARGEVVGPGQDRQARRVGHQHPGGSRTASSRSTRRSAPSSRARGSTSSARPARSTSRRTGGSTRLAYDIWQVKPDGTSAPFKTITFKP